MPFIIKIVLFSKFSKKIDKNTNIEERDSQENSFRSVGVAKNIQHNQKSIVRTQYKTMDCAKFDRYSSLLTCRQ